MKLATLERNKYFLESGEELHEENPHTFYQPSKEARDGLKNGDIVKLVFHMEAQDYNGSAIERMWVIVQGRRNDLYTGVLDNDPYENVAVKSGDTVVFKAEHVIDIYED